MANKEIELLEYSEVDSFIMWQLLKDWCLVTFVFFVLDFYDENADSFLYLKAFKVKIKN